MDDRLREARKVLSVLKENLDMLDVLLEVAMRLGPKAVEELSYSDLAHLATCKRTYTNCRVPICRMLRLDYYDNLKEIERERRYWRAKRRTLPGGKRIPEIRTLE